MRHNNLLLIALNSIIILISANGKCESGWTLVSELSKCIRAFPFPQVLKSAQEVCESHDSYVYHEDRPSEFAAHLTLPVFEQAVDEIGKGCMMETRDSQRPTMAPIVPNPEMYCELHTTYDVECSKRTTVLTTTTTLATTEKAANSNGTSNEETPTNGTNNAEQPAVRFRRAKGNKTIKADPKGKPPNPPTKGGDKKKDNATVSVGEPTVKPDNEKKDEKKATTIEAKEETQETTQVVTEPGESQDQTEAQEQTEAEQNDEADQEAITQSQEDNEDEGEADNKHTTKSGKKEKNADKPKLGCGALSAGFICVKRNNITTEDKVDAERLMRDVIQVSIFIVYTVIAVGHLVVVNYSRVFTHRLWRQHRLTRKAVVKMVRHMQAMQVDSDTMSAVVTEIGVPIEVYEKEKEEEEDKHDPMAFLKHQKSAAAAKKEAAAEIAAEDGSKSAPKSNDKKGKKSGSGKKSKELEKKEEQEEE